MVYTDIQLSEKQFGNSYQNAFTTARSFVILGEFSDKIILGEFSDKQQI